MTTEELKPTEEQINILNSSSKKIAINALAGTGKTSTLKMIAKSNPDKKFLYLCYNASIAKEAKLSFPKNVKVLTFHGLAYAFVGNKYKDRLNTNLSVSEIISILKLDSSARKQLLGQCIMNTLLSYCASSDQYIENHHVDYDYLRAANIFKGKDQDDIDVILTKIKNLTAKLWNEIVPYETSHNIVPDIYLKIFTLQNNVVNYDGGIMIDEAQDLTPCFIKFIEKQNSNLILVGDKNQSINKWKGCVNYLEEPSYDKYTLTQSFRFGPKIAELSNVVLNYLKTDMEIKGFNINTKIDTYINKQNNKYLLTAAPDNESKAIICRSNFTILENLIRLILEGKECFVEGGIDYNEIKDLQELYNLKVLRKTSHPQYSGYSSFEELESLINDGTIIDPILARKVYNVSSWGHQFTKKLGLIKNYIAKSKNIVKTNKHIILTTLHKSKGREYDNVILEDDFNHLLSYDQKENIPKYFDEVSKVHRTYKMPDNQDAKYKLSYGDLTERQIEELNIFYVALTRVKKQLFMSDLQYNFINYHADLLKEGLTEKNIKMINEARIHIDDSYKIFMEKIVLKKQNQDSFKQNVVKKKNNKI